MLTINDVNKLFLLLEELRIKLFWAGYCCFIVIVKDLQQISTKLNKITSKARFLVVVQVVIESASALIKRWFL